MKDFVIFTLLAYIAVNLAAMAAGSLDYQFQSSKHRCAAPNTRGHYLVLGYSLGCWLAEPVEKK